MYKSVNDHEALFQGCIMFYTGSAMKTLYFYIVSFSMGRGNIKLQNLRNTKIRFMKYLMSFEV